MKSIYITVATVLGLSLIFMSLKTKKSDPESRKLKWEKIESNISRQVDPKTTLKMVKDLLKDIEKDNASDELVKAKMYIHLLNIRTTDDTDNLNQQLLNDIEADFTQLDFPEKNYMAVLVSKLISEYTDNNKWDIENRKNDNYNSEDFTTWKMIHFNEKLDFYKKEAFKNSSDLKSISIHDAAALFMHSDKKKAYIKNVLQAISNLDLENHKRKLYNANISTLDIEDAFSGTTTHKELQDYLNAFDTYRSLFSSDAIKQKLEMELWVHLLSLKQNPKIEEIYINNLVSLNTHSKKSVKAEKNYRIALYYFAKANALEFGSITDINEINALKTEKTKIYKNVLKYIEKVLAISSDKNTTVQEIQNLARNIKQNITTVETYFLGGKSSYISTQDLLFELTSKNIRSLELEVYKLDIEEYIKVSKTLHWNERKRILNHLTQKEKVWYGEYSIDYTSEFIEDKRQIVVPKLGYGFYAITKKDNPEDIQIFQVSDLFVSKMDEKIQVKSALDNSIIKDAVLYLSIGSKKTKKFDESGILKHSGNKTSNLMVVSGDDSYILMNQYFYGYSRTRENRTLYRDQIFMDRAIYRPGQKIQIKIQQKSRKEKDILFALSNKTKATLKLYDTQHQLVEEKTISLNEFSAGQTNFILPKDLPNGQFHISSSHGSQYFRVEEYKRPTFFVDFEKDSTEKQIGDIIKLPLLAKTFSGINLANAKVEYTIKYSNIPSYFWRCGYYSWSQDYILTNQKVDLDKSGKVDIEINTNDIPEAMKENDLVRFTIEAKVVDINGDSETETTSFTLSKEGLTLGRFNAIKQLEGKDFELEAKVTNFQSLPLTKTISYQISELEQPEVIFFRNNSKNDRPFLLPNGIKTKNGLKHFPELKEGNMAHWQVKAKISSGKFESNKPFELKDELKPGVYRISYSVNDKFGNTISKDQFITIYPKKKKNLPKSESIFVSVNQKSFKTKDQFKANIYLPLKSKYNYVLSDFNGEITSGTTDGQSILKLNETLKERSKGGLVLDIRTVYQNKTFTKSMAFNVDWELDLTAKWVSVNNKVRPQSEENWKLEISYKNKPVESTEVLAFMYDASLDEITKHNISNLIDQKAVYYASDFLKSRQITNHFPVDFIQYNHLGNTAVNSLKGITYVSGLNRIGLDNNTRYFIDGIKAMPMLANAEMDSDEMFEDAVNTSNNRSAGRSKKMRKVSKSKSISGYSSEKQTSSDQEKSKSTQIRKNFQETIFFYPELKSDENGLVDIPFTMSDGMGKFKLMVYGYTKDLKQFYLEEDIISNKELMAEMHKPRFLYSGDEMIWTAKISNLSINNQNAKIQLKLTDALNNSMIFDSGNGSKTLSLTSGGSQKVEWKVKIPENFVGEIKYELRAETNKFVDVEIDQIPVLTTQTLINENFAITIGGNTSKTFKLADIINAQNFEQFRIECMANPIWQVIKALPYSKSTDDKVISNLLDEYITIKIGQNILAKNPQISAKLLALSKTTQTSVLKDKQELKAISLEESPWLADAKSQEEEMKQLANFFDRNNLMNRLKTIERKITKHQSNAGGFSWIKGGKDSYWMSLYVAKSLSNLEKLGLAKDDLKDLKTTLLAYLDQEILKRYNLYKKEDVLSDIKVSNVPYLETRTIFLNDYSVEKSARVAYEFFLERSLKHWSDASFVDRITLSKIAHGNGDLKTSDDIFKTLDEYRLENEEQQTIYWKELANGLSWNNRKFVNHADLIHLYHVKGQPKSEIVRLQNWLLQQKRSQYWGSSSQTSQLIYAMLLNVNDNNIFGDVELDIKINGKTIDFSETEGWLSKTWLNNKGIDLKTATLEVSNTEDHPIWISGYHQYFTKISEVKAEKTSDCTLTKVFYRREFKNNVESWEKTNLEELNVGDEIKVNVTLDIPQSLDFVYLQDYFGACFEPVDNKSGFKWDRKGSYYLNIKDQKMQFFFDHISRGTHEFEFVTRVKQRGQFSNGFAEFQSYYAPEFGGHSDSKSVKVNK